LRHTVGATANEAERLKVKHYERYHHEGIIVPFPQDSAGGLANKAIQFTNFIYQGITNGISRGWISEKERFAHKKRFADTLSAVAAKHRVLDIIAMGFQTVDDIGNDRRKKCINLYSPDQDNRYLRLASINIIENRGGLVQRVGRSSVRGSEVIRDSLVE
jgi:hypothetical protein